MQHKLSQTCFALSKASRIQQDDGVRVTWLLLAADELAWAVLAERESRKAWSATEFPQENWSFPSLGKIWTWERTTVIFTDESYFRVRAPEGKQELSTNMEKGFLFLKG